MIAKITIAMNLCVNWYYITDFDLELLEIILDFHCLLFFTEQYYAVHNG